MCPFQHPLLLLDEPVCTLDSKGMKIVENIIMEVLQLLATALGVSALAGINLYLTVFATSIALNLGWLHLGPGMESLQALGHPLVLLIAGILYFLEFFVDKVPWVDSLWDGVHTIIRPLGAVLLSLSVLGQVNPTLEILAAILCGGVAFSTHATKAGTRAIVNASPEPFSNSVVSLAEDAVVIGGLVSVYTHPIPTAIAVLLFLALFVYLAPRLFRHLCAIAGFAFHRLMSFASGRGEAKELSVNLPLESRQQLDTELKEGEVLSWAVPAFTGRVPSFPRNRSCNLFFTQPFGRLGIHVSGKPVKWFEVKDVETDRRPRLLFDELILFDRSTRKVSSIRFNKKQRCLLDTVQEDLVRHTGKEAE